MFATPIIAWSEQFCSDSAWSVRAQYFISLKPLRFVWEINEVLFAPSDTQCRAVDVLVLCWPALPALPLSVPATCIGVRDPARGSRRRLLLAREYR
jgi:hypothetical protein